MNLSTKTTHAMITIDNPLQNIDLASLSGRDIADNLDMIKNALDSIKGIEGQLKEEAKTRLLRGESVKGYDIVKKTPPRKVKDINELFKILSEHNIDNRMFIDACSVSMPKLEEIYANVNKAIRSDSADDVEHELSQYIEDKPKITKKQLKEEFKEITKDLIEEGKTTTSIRKI